MENSLELFDQNLLVKINSFHSDWMDTVMWYSSSTVFFLPFPFLILFLYYRRYKLRNTVALILCCGISVTLTDISTNRVKHLVERYRPTHNLEVGPKLHLVKDPKGQVYRGGKFGFFSSHAANTFGISTLFFFAANWIHRKKRWLFFLIPLPVIYSRMYMGVHYPSDVLVGSLSGFLIGYATFLVFRKYFFKSPLINE